MRVGIVGCGQIADAHLQQIQRIEGAETVAVVDLNRHLAEQAAKRFQVESWFTDIEQMIKEAKPDVIHITTPPNSHYTLAKIILKHGLHIYMEKPFTTNLAEAKEIVELAGKKGCQICVGYSYAFDPSYLKLVDAYKKGRLGQVVHMNATMGYGLGGPFGKVMMSDPKHWVHKLPGGIPQNNISHPISLIMGIVKEENFTVHAKGYKFREERYNDIRDEFFDELRISLYGEKISANILFSAKIKPVGIYLDVYGTEAMAHYNLYARTLIFNKGASLPGPFEKVHWARNYYKEAKREYKTNLKNLIRANLHYFDGMKILTERFYKAIQNGTELPVPMSEAVEETKIIEDIFQQVKI